MPRVADLNQDSALCALTLLHRVPKARPFPSLGTSLPLALRSGAFFEFRPWCPVSTLSLRLLS